jgi:hypothetical protein
VSSDHRCIHHQHAWLTLAFSSVAVPRGSSRDLVSVVTPFLATSTPDVKPAMASKANCFGRTTMMSDQRCPKISITVDGSNGRAKQAGFISLDELSWRRKKLTVDSCAVALCKSAG